MRKGVKGEERGGATKSGGGGGGRGSVAAGSEECVCPGTRVRGERGQTSGVGAHGGRGRRWAPIGGCREWASHTHTHTGHGR